jgi:hypothetical protein
MPNQGPPESMKGSSWTLGQRGRPVPGNSQSPPTLNIAHCFAPRFVVMNTLPRTPRCPGQSGPHGRLRVGNLAPTADHRYGNSMGRSVSRAAESGETAADTSQACSTSGTALRPHQTVGFACYLGNPGVGGGCQLGDHRMIIRIAGRMRGSTRSSPSGPPCHACSVRPTPVRR